MYMKLIANSERKWIVLSSPGSQVAVDLGCGIGMKVGYKSWETLKNVLPIRNFDKCQEVY